VLSNQGLDKGEFILGNPKVGMKIPNWDFDKTQNGLEWECRNRKKSLFLGTFGGFLKTSKDKNGPQITNPEKII